MANINSIDNIDTLKWNGHSVATFGHSGILIIASAKHQHFYTVNSPQTTILKNTPAPITITTLADLVYPYVLSRYSRFSGPLLGRQHRMKKTAVVALLDSILTNIDGARGNVRQSIIERGARSYNLHQSSIPAAKTLSTATTASTASASSHISSTEILWKLLHLYVIHDGILLGSKNDPEIISKIKELLYPLMSPRSTNNTHIHSLQSFLMQGEISEAYNYAITNSLWAHALIISKNIDSSTFSNTVSKFATLEFTQSHMHSASKLDIDQHEFAPIHLLYGLIAGKGADAVNDILKYHTINWADLLCIILSNRTPNDLFAISCIGDYLSSIGQIVEANLCYLLCFTHASVNSIDLARILLIGVDHLKYPNTFHKHAEFIQLTEMFEYAKNLSIPTTFELLPHFIPYKIKYSFELSDLGFIDMGTEYISVLETKLSEIVAKNQISQMALYHNLVAEYGDRLRIKNHKRRNSVDSSSWLKKLGDIGGAALGKGLDSFMTAAVGEKISSPESKQPAEKYGKSTFFLPVSLPDSPQYANPVPRTGLFAPEDPNLRNSAASSLASDYSYMNNKFEYQTGQVESYSPSPKPRPLSLNDDPRQTNVTKKVTRNIHDISQFAYQPVVDAANNNNLSYANFVPNSVPSEFETYNASQFNGQSGYEYTQNANINENVFADPSNISYNYMQPAFDNNSAGTYNNAHTADSSKNAYSGNISHGLLQPQINKNSESSIIYSQTENYLSTNNTVLFSETKISATENRNSAYMPYDYQQTYASKYSNHTQEQINEVPESNYEAMYPSYSEYGNINNFSENNAKPDFQLHSQTGFDTSQATVNEIPQQEYGATYIEPEYKEQFQTTFNVSGSVQSSLQSSAPEKTFNNKTNHFQNNLNDKSQPYHNSYNSSNGHEFFDNFSTDQNQYQEDTILQQNITYNESSEKAIDNGAFNYNNQEHSIPFESAGNPLLDNIPMPYIQRSQDHYTQQVSNTQNIESANRDENFSSVNQNATNNFNNSSFSPISNWTTYAGNEPPSKDLAIKKAAINQVPQNYNSNFNNNDMSQYQPQNVYENQNYNTEQNIYQNQSNNFNQNAENNNYGNLNLNQEVSYQNNGKIASQSINSDFNQNYSSLKNDEISASVNNNIIKSGMDMLPSIDSSYIPQATAIMGVFNSFLGSKGSTSSPDKSQPSANTAADFAASDDLGFGNTTKIKKEKLEEPDSNSVIKKDQKIDPSNSAANPGLVSSLWNTLWKTASGASTPTGDKGKVGFSKANLGSNAEPYFDDVKQKWVFPGQETVSETSSILAPPPMTKAPPSTPQANNSAMSSMNPSPSVSGVSSPVPPSLLGDVNQKPISGNIGMTSRRGLRSKYVDVLNPNAKSENSFSIPSIPVKNLDISRTNPVPFIPKPILSQENVSKNSQPFINSSLHYSSEMETRRDSTESVSHKPFIGNTNGVIEPKELGKQEIKTNSMTNVNVNLRSKMGRPSVRPTRNHGSGNLNVSSRAPLDL